MSECRVAVLVDGDNISARHADTIMEEAGKLGTVTVARVYAAANQTSEWVNAHGYRFMHAGTGKNASDLLLSIDAMEFMYSDGYGNFVIASSDGDFTHLAQRLRERGAHVLGLGEEKASEAYRRSCSRFGQLPSLRTEKPKKPQEPAVQISQRDKNIMDMIRSNGINGGGMPIAMLGPRMHSQHGVKISSLPEKTWRNYLASRPALFDIDPRGPNAMVRIAGKKTAGR